MSRFGKNLNLKKWHFDDFDVCFFNIDLRKNKSGNKNCYRRDYQRVAKKGVIIPGAGL